MRYVLPCCAVLALAACGGGGDGGPSLLTSATSALGGNSHNCAQPAPSGSPEQIACHDAAEKSCPIGTAPDQVDFSEDDAGQFVVRGYSCV